MNPECQRPFASYVWSAEDYSALRAAASSLSIKAEDLLLVMSYESGLNPHAAFCKNGEPFAVGLNQITSNALIPNKTAYLSLTAVEQMPTIVRYFKTLGRNVAGMTAVDLYHMNFAPGTFPNEAIFYRGSKAYEDNKGLDKDGDGVISRADLSQVMYEASQSSLYKKALAQLGGKMPVISRVGMRSSSSSTGGALVAVGAGLLAFGLLRRK